MNFTSLAEQICAFTLDSQLQIFKFIQLLNQSKVIDQHSHIAAALLKWLASNETFDRSLTVVLCEIKKPSVNLTSLNQQQESTIRQNASDVSRPPLLQKSQSQQRKNLAIRQQQQNERSGESSINDMAYEEFQLPVEPSSSYQQQSEAQAKSQAFLQAQTQALPQAKPQTSPLSRAKRRKARKSIAAWHLVNAGNDVIDSDDVIASNDVIDDDDVILNGIKMENDEQPPTMVKVHVNMLPVALPVHTTGDGGEDTTISNNINNEDDSSSFLDDSSLDKTAEPVCPCPKCEEYRNLPPESRRCYITCDEDGCNKIYKASSHMKHLYFWHNGPKPYLCEYDGCGKSFIHGSDFSRHTKVHTGERPHLCQTCGKKFSDISYLNAHKKKQHAFALSRRKRKNRGSRSGKTFSCTMCEKAYTDIRSLARHKRSHCADKIFECPRCKKMFGASTMLEEHLKFYPSHNISVDADGPSSSTTSSLINSQGLEQED